MKISYNWLKNYIDLDPVEHSPECLQEVLPLLGFDIEEIEKQAKQVKILTVKINDAGHTQIPSGSLTVLALCPDEEEKLDELTGELKLL